MVLFVTLQSFPLILLARGHNSLFGWDVVWWTHLPRSHFVRPSASNFSQSISTIFSYWSDWAHPSMDQSLHRWERRLGHVWWVAITDQCHRTHSSTFALRNERLFWRRLILFWWSLNLQMTDSHRSFFLVTLSIRLKFSSSSPYLLSDLELVCSTDCRWRSMKLGFCSRAVFEWWMPYSFVLHILNDAGNGTITKESVFFSA